MLVEGLKDIFARLQMEYVAETAMAAKRGEDTHTPAMKLAVLDDVVETIMQEITTGRKAQKRLDKRLEESGVSNG